MDKICFVISPIGDPGSDIREFSDEVLEYIIAPAVRTCGYIPLRSDQISETGLITLQVIKHLREDPLVIADLTRHNPNVFYELAYRHSVGKPVVMVIQKDWKIPFDIAPMRCIEFDLAKPSNVSATINEIVRQTEEIENSPLFADNPISLANRTEQLISSREPLEESLAQIIDMLHDVRAFLYDDLTSNSTLGYATEEELLLAQPIVRQPVAGKALAYKHGDKVKHAVFGNGTVVSINPAGDDAQVTVAFPAPIGIKKLMASFAKLEKV